MFITALFVIARSWEKPRCSSTEKWIRKTRHIYILEYYSSVQKQMKNDILKFACRWMELEKVKMLNEVTQIQKDEHGIYSLISGY